MSVDQANIRMLRALRLAFIDQSEANREAAAEADNGEIAVIQLTNAHLLLDIAGACRKAADELQREQDEGIGK